MDGNERLAGNMTVRRGMAQNASNQLTMEQETWQICGWMVYGSSLQENAAHQRRQAFAAMVDRLGEFSATTVVEIGPGYGAIAEKKAAVHWIGNDISALTSPELAQLQDAYLS